MILLIGIINVKLCTTLSAKKKKKMNNFELCRTVRTVSAKKNKNKNKNKNNAREVETLLVQGKKSFSPSNLQANP